MGKSKDMKKEKKKPKQEKPKKIDDRF